MEKNNIKTISFNEVFNKNISINEIKKTIKQIEKLKEKFNQEYLKYSRILEYSDMLKEGFSKKQIKNFIKEDDLAIKNAKQYVKKYNKLKDYMFGYPANLVKDSSVTKYLREQETKLSIMNNCADTYEQGNYQMDSKEYEREILKKLFLHFNLKPPTKKNGKYIGSWGYITSGGSESNRWGIENGLRKLQGGHVYFSTSAHYSVEKAVQLGFNHNGKVIEIPYTKVPSYKNSEKINVEILIDEIKKNWKKNKTPAVVVLTWGTTKTGAIDEIEKISQLLKNIPHYIHLDAALFGGIAKNQINAPEIPDFSKHDIDSIAVSLHKYIGNYDVKSAIIAKEKPNAKKIDYIGQQDSTTAGSRTINPFSALQKVTEAVERKMPFEYYKNIEKFEKLLKKNNIKYLRENNSNIFVIDKPSDKICKKYQLSDFRENNKNKAHIIIFPYHKLKIMKELITDLLNTKK